MVGQDVKNPALPGGVLYSQHPSGIFRNRFSQEKPPFSTNAVLDVPQISFIWPSTPSQTRKASAAYRPRPLLRPLAVGF